MRTVTLKPPECTIWSLRPDDWDAVWMLPKRETHFERRIARQDAGDLEYIAAFVSLRALAFYERVGYTRLGDVYLEGTYEIEDDDGCTSLYEDWCVDMVKSLR